MKPVRYAESDTAVFVGDYVEFKSALFFWKGWQTGRVYYVPGISPQSQALEHGGLAWVSIQDSRGAQTGFLIDPDTHELRGHVRFVRRSDDGFEDTPAGYSFRD